MTSTVVRAATMKGLVAKSYPMPLLPSTRPPLMPSPPMPGCYHPFQPWALVRMAMPCTEGCLNRAEQVSVPY